MQLGLLWSTSPWELQSPIARPSGGLQEVGGVASMVLDGFQGQITPFSFAFSRTAWLATIDLHLICINRRWSVGA
jgi:hypothetical protein